MKTFNKKGPPKILVYQGKPGDCPGIAQPPRRYEIPASAVRCDPGKMPLRLSARRCGGQEKRSDGAAGLIRAWVNRNCTEPAVQMAEPADALIRRESL